MTNSDITAADRAQLAAAIGIDVASIEDAQLDIYSPAFNADVDSDALNAWVYTASMVYYVRDFAGRATVAARDIRERGLW